MKKDNSSNNFNYPGLSIEKIVSNPDEYIIPECIDACKMLWNKNIFTVSCSNRDEKKDENGYIKKYIIVGNLSDENKKIFEGFINSKSQNKEIFEGFINSKSPKYVKLIISDKYYYAIYILSEDNIENRDEDSQRLLESVSPFKMQDCLEGYISIYEYYRKYILDCPYSNGEKGILNLESEQLDSVKKHLSSKGKLDLLDLKRGIVYDSEYYKRAHERYLEMQQQRDNDLQEYDIVL